MNCVCMGECGNAKTPTPCVDGLNTHMTENGGFLCACAPSDGPGPDERVSLFYFGGRWDGLVSSAPILDGYVYTGDCRATHLSLVPTSQA
jgi:hypothetical protein